LGLPTNKSSANTIKSNDKSTIRQNHSIQRRELLQNARGFISQQGAKLLPHFASGDEIRPDRISPYLEVVASGTKEADLFRMASLSWSVPVSAGYGRRIRYLVWDQDAEKLMGIIALGDPVFNLGVRDRLIGWNSTERKDRLVNLMDAFVLGAVPPYNMVLGGKLVASLVRTRDVRESFEKKYGGSRGVISKKKKHAQLAGITTSSALGRSSLYNRLALGGIKYFRPIGFTLGYGHFHVPSGLFDDIRAMLHLHNHPYATGNRFGNGPNWRFRAIRAALQIVGLDRDLLRHGIQREVFFCPLATNAEDVLKNKSTIADYGDLLSVREVGDLAVARWVAPRAERNPGYADWKREEFIKIVT